MKEKLRFTNKFVSVLQKYILYDHDVKINSNLRKLHAVKVDMYKKMFVLNCCILVSMRSNNKINYGNK